MVWAGANAPQELDATPESCRHEGPMFHVRDEDGTESVSCASCIADEIETQLLQGVVYRWEITRLTDDDEEEQP